MKQISPDMPLSVLAERHIVLPGEKRRRKGSIPLRINSAIYKVHKKHPLWTVSDFCELGAEEIAMQNNIGIKSIDFLVDFLAQHGLVIKNIEDAKKIFNR